MTRLLVSVRDATEARLALAGGADLIDVKEPSRGPLGMADGAVIGAVAAEVAGRAPLSAALGELDEGHHLDAALAGQISYAKHGLAGCQNDRRWQRRWQAAIAALPPGVTAVAVAYADWPTAGAPHPREVLEHGAAPGCGAALLDTFNKHNGSLLTQMKLEEVQCWIAAARAAGLRCVVAGSLGVDEIERLVPVRPDYIGVRGAACRGGRTAALDARRVAELAARLRRAIDAQSPTTTQRDAGESRTGVVVDKKLDKSGLSAENSQ